MTYWVLAPHSLCWAAWLQHRCQQVGKPPHKLFPRRPPFIPSLFGQPERSCFVALKHLVKLLRGVGVYDDGILFIVVTQATGIEVGTAHSAELAIDHDDLGVVKPVFVYPHLHPMFHQLVHVVEHTVGCEGYVAVGRHHHLHLDSTFYRLAQCLFQFAVEREIGIDEFDTVLRIVDGPP